jgi:NAD(P)-dependent dehydrogenase (short-subunit alcohol dehydrogenase family)
MLRAMANQKRENAALVALVACGPDGIGREIALALAARGVRIVVTGADERAIAEIVGEIAFGGGKARHVAGDPTDPAVVRAAVARATETFGAINLAVADPEIAQLVFASAFARSTRS